MNEWKGKNVFITGAGGFIGAAVAHELSKLGANVTCLVKNRSWERSVFLPGLVCEGDVTDYDRMTDIISTEEVEYIFHFAANAIVRIGARDPMNTYRTNVMGTVVLLEAARNVGRCKKILVASSDKAYGDHDILPYTEDMALEPKNTYDTSKACADLIARSYAHNYGMPVVVTRCSNVYGPGDPNDSRIIPNSIKRMLSGKPAELYSDISSMEREFIFIDDVVDACLKLALTDKATNGEAFNIGGGGPKSIEGVVKMIADAMGKPMLKPVIIPRDPEFKEIAKQYIDASRLEIQTGWSRQTSLVEGLSKTIEWYMGEGK